MPSVNWTPRLWKKSAKSLRTLPSGWTGTRKAELDRIAQRTLSHSVSPSPACVNSGKSTLVNALLRQAVAPTDVSECTRVVTWFQQGNRSAWRSGPTTASRSTVQLERSDARGRSPGRCRSTSQGSIGSAFYLDNEVLALDDGDRHAGLGSINEEISASAEQLLAMEREFARGGGERGRHRVCHQSDGQGRRSAHADLWAEAGGTRVPRARAHELGGECHRRAHQGRQGRRWQRPLAGCGRARDAAGGAYREKVATVVPVIGLLAATANTAALTERDAADLEDSQSSTPKSGRDALSLGDSGLGGVVPRASCWCRRT